MRLPLFVAAAALLSASLIAHADPIVNYDLSLTTATGDFSGTLSLDLTTGLFSAANIPVVLEGKAFVLSIVSPYFQGTFGGDNSYQVEFDDPTYIASLELTLPVTSLTGYTGGSICSTKYTCMILGSGLNRLIPYSPGSPGTDEPEPVISGSIELAPAPDTPEPSSILLLGTGLLGVAGVMRKRFA